MSKLTFEQMNKEADFERYDRLARAEMNDNDLVDGRELRQLIAEQAVRAWWVFRPGREDPVGWCSIFDTPPFGWERKTTHIFGIIVFGSEKRNGIGREIIRWLIDQYGEGYLTAAIAPTNLASERAFQSMGFVLINEEEDEYWRTWRRCPNGIPPTRDRTS